MPHPTGSDAPSRFKLRRTAVPTSSSRRQSSPESATRGRAIRALSLVAALAAYLCGPVEASNREINLNVLRDKIKGGWIGHMAGVSWGGPTEFQYKGAIMPDSAVPADAMSEEQTFRSERSLSPRLIRLRRKWVFASERTSIIGD